MRKSMYLLGLAAIVIFGAGCSKDKGNGTTRAYSPNSCYNGGNNGYANNGYGNNGYNSGYNNGYNGGNNGGYNSGYNGGNGYNNANYNRNNNSGIGNNNQYGQRYQWQNGQCIDTNDGDVVSASACNNVRHSNNASCTNYGYGNGYYQGNVQGAYNACSVYNTASEQFYPVHYAHLGVTVCAGYSAFNTMYGAGIPSFYPGYQNVFQGCIPGVSGAGRCACNSFGGRLGWMSAGIQLGVCY